MVLLTLTLLAARPRLFSREDGQTMAEYGILVTVIAVVIIAAATVFGGSVSALFSASAPKL